MGGLEDLLYLVTIFLSFLFTVFGTPRLIKLMVKLGIVDKPDKHKIHSEPIPRMGGIIIFAVVWVLMTALNPELGQNFFFFSGMLIIVTLGMVDDVKNIIWYKKLAVQAIVSVLLMVYLFRHFNSVITFGGIDLPNIVGYLLLFAFIVGTINAFNLMDGLDGLVTGQALIIASIYMLLGLKADLLLIPILAAALIGSTVGFLKFNAHPARIFLGDTGSLLLGFFSITLIVTTNAEMGNHSIDLVAAIIVLGVPIVDTLRVIFVRMQLKHSPFLADKSHMHHIILSKGLKHKNTVFMMLGFSLLFALTSLFYLFVSQLYGIIIYAFILLSFVFTGQLIEFIIRRKKILDYLLNLRNLFPVVIINTYTKILLPLVLILFGAFMGFLIYNESIVKHNENIFFIVFIFLLIGFALYELKNKNYITDFFVLISFCMFFFLVGLNGTFYTLLSIPFIGKLNINQLFVIILVFMIIVFVLFKERITGRQILFFTGIDLVIGMVIVFLYVSIIMAEIPDGFKISDTLVRSFLLYLIYKITILCYPKVHLTLYFSTFAVTVIVLFKTFI
ncbi:MAG: undecaprenyl/decaprenyl-phosphate alpha-N-acetylglucosaminyl 1-phosphate transferase [Ignavibacteriaceae bacterium]|nr:undecaprenyl/decaprenyl-phosphate alpha-N-acetylglucosaminyl 1-phosphate transferase [Ignavibacteriaceae bacterium]